MRPTTLKTRAVLLLAFLCNGMLIAAAEADWSSPTTANLADVFTVNAGDGWTAGDSGTILQWTGTKWIPEFPTTMLIPILIILTLIAVLLAKTASKKRTKPQQSSHY